uniref:Cellulase n=1 Tax=Phaedon cochleariae TaxID=80249 RepID=K7DWA7_PHACE|nr:glycoside hydrolase family 45 protein [Phaedon cochleariae]
MKLIVLVSALLLASCHAEPSPTIIPIEGGVQGDGVTTRYWDCCATSCAWDQIVHTKNGQPVQTCTKDGRTHSTKENNAQSGCAVGGVAYSCSNQVAWVINSTLAYGFSAASFTGGIDNGQCCICVLLSFKGQLAGKQMLVQVTNTGSDLGKNHFDLAMPGGGVGIFTLGCSSQWGTPPSGWGEEIGGVQTEEECNQLPGDLQEGCKFRFRYLEGVPNPNVAFQQVRCPSELVALTGCGDLD